MFNSLFIPGSHFTGVAKAQTPMTKPRRFRSDGLRGTLKSLLGTMVMLGFVGTSFGDSLPGKVKVMTERDGANTRFLLRNYETTDMTATLEVAAVNMKSSVSLPCTITIPAGQTVEALVLTPTNSAGSDWSFNYTNHYTVGRHDATHDDSHVYFLPYAAGTTYKVTQGYHGSFSHKGPDEYSTDWKMPEGTPVHAAREGVVVSVKDDSEKGGSHRKFEDCANMVTVQHADGTMAHYCHLAPHSAKVRVGQKIRAGDLLAASGNTGFTSGPHLHFAVFKARSGFGRESIPVKFRTAKESGISLVSGQSYRAGDPAAMARK
jgi:murein DD-endopeptidase MepM/ murein hydrolase activator NlpD